jgi:cytochrome c peroxidase
VELYSNLLLHRVFNVDPPTGFVGVTQGNAISGFYRTPSLRGLRNTAPYFHDGRSETIDAAIRRHDGEALGMRQTYENILSDTERDALLAFLESL